MIQPRNLLTGAAANRYGTVPTHPFTMHEWTCSAFCITGDKQDKSNKKRTEDVELWHRNPVDCIRELMGNPAFNGKQTYEPCQIYKNDDYTNQEYNEFSTADWWWEVQVGYNFYGPDSVFLIQLLHIG